MASAQRSCRPVSHPCERHVPECGPGIGRCLPDLHVCQDIHKSGRILLGRDGPQQVCRPLWLRRCQHDLGQISDGVNDDAFITQRLGDCNDLRILEHGLWIVRLGPGQIRAKGERPCLSPVIVEVRIQAQRLIEQLLCDGKPTGVNAVLPQQ